MSSIAEDVNLAATEVKTAMDEWAATGDTSRMQALIIELVAENKNLKAKTDRLEFEIKPQLRELEDRQWSARLHDPSCMVLMNASNSNPSQCSCWLSRTKPYRS